MNASSPIPAPLRARAWLTGALLVLVSWMLTPLAVHAAEQLYTCGMHPQIIKKEPGNCPICGMKLTPIRANATRPAGTSAGGERVVKYYKSTMIPGEVKPGPGKDSMGMDMVPVYEGEDASGENHIQIDAATTQRMNLKTAPVERGPVRRAIRAFGTVAYNEEGLRDITLKYEGWIEKLHVNATWTTVKAGDPLFEIYSPDLYNAQLNYVVALRTQGDKDGPMVRAALARLELFDVPADLIEELKQSGKVSRTLVFRAPADGVVIEKMAVEGQMMKPGERIYRLADFSSVWVNAQIYEKDLPFIHPDQPVSIRASYGAERTFDGTVQLLLPQVEERTRTATARIVLPNPDGFLRPGMFVDVNFTSRIADDAVLVPDMAVLRSGERNTVFVALDDGFFEPREVKIGARGEGGFYQVLSGLRAGERVVTSGQFMLDSESQLRESIQKMLRNTEASTAGSAPAMPASASDPAPVASNPAVVPLLKPVALAAADAGAALAADDLSAYKRQLPALRDALAAYFSGDPHAAHGPLGKFQDGFAEPADLEAARVAFEPFSTAIADLARENHLQHTEKLHIFECPMAPVTGRARWLQREAGTKNPFFGSEMLECGDEIPAPAPAAKPSAFALPPGHPPLDGATVAAFAALRTEAPARADESCGSCGMTKAAMAAGEPCEM